jgi:hypothetical protein
MEKDLFKYLNGEVNAVKIEVVLVRERLPNGIEHLTVSTANEGRLLLCEQWKNPKKKPRSDTPKHTGGKKPYIMLMVDEVEKLRKDGVKNVEELVGYLVCLGKFVEWNTGKLIQKRSKKPIRYKDLQGIFPCGNRKLNRILGELKEHDLLFGTEEGYFISTRLIKKGKTKKEAVRNG